MTGDDKDNILGQFGESAFHQTLEPACLVPAGNPRSPNLPQIHMPYYIYNTNYSKNDLMKVRL
jgi:hypothetical protein